MPPFVPPEYTPQARAERLIALGRFVLAAFSLGAIWYEPSTPAQHARTTYTLLGSYTIYALLLIVHTWRSQVPARRQRLVSHVVDLVLFTIFIYLTEGPASPFFLYFVFSLFCATLRFRWSGIVATGAAATAIYLALTLATLLLGGDVVWSRVLIRVAYLDVITALLAYLAIYQEQLRSELAALAAWPREPAFDLDRVLRSSLAHAAALLKAERILFVWEEAEEPWMYVAVWSGGRLAIDRHPPGRYAFAELHDASFFTRGSSRALVREADAHDAIERDIDPVGAQLREDAAITTALGVAIESESVNGRLFAADVGNATADDLILAHIVGRLLLASLEELFFVRHIRQTASVEERLRIARDLHDGVIQSLSGVGLQLQSIRARVSDATTAARIADVQHVIESEQRELREIVRDLRPVEPPRDDAANLQRRLQRIAERYLLEWNMVVEMQTNLSMSVPHEASQAVYRIVNESLSNAARHGRATRATVNITAANDRVAIRVSDNGRGFPFAGRHDHIALNRLGLGPKTLKERVAKLGGTLVVDSSPRGAAIEASFPLPEKAA
jgi:signal transduction histidine kinase